MLRKVLCFVFALTISMNCFAAIVSDDDGSAFITKSEFEALKKNFASQIEQYNTSIDTKLDGAIAYYLAGIKLQKKEEKSLLLWGGRKLGLIENELSRPYVEGRVGGRMDFTLYSCAGGSTDWFYGMTTVADDATPESHGQTNPTYFKTCFHRFTANSVPFRYLVVDVNKSDGNYYFNLLGYAKVTETISALHRTHVNADLTQRSAWTVGLCGGVYSYRGPLEQDCKSYTNNFVMFCEATDRQSGRGSYAARGASFDDHHNQYMLTWQDITIDSNQSVQNDIAYVTNAASNTVYNGIRTRTWHGVNATNGTTETHTKGEIHTWGWNVAASRGTKYNFHIDARLSDSTLFHDGAGVFDRIIQGDSGYSSGQPGHYPSTMAHGTVSDNNNFYSLYKADIGGELKSNNLYSNELAAVIKEQVKTGLIKKNFNGVEQDVSPLYLGLPIAEVREDDVVELEFDLLDNLAEYDIAFTIGGFNNQPISQSQFADAGCTVEGFSNHIAHFPTTRTESKQKVKVEIDKTGILFIKFSASGGTSQYIQLPSTCTIIG